jgi:hypothetical protein
MRFGRFLFCAGALLTLSATSAAAAPAYVLPNVNLRSGPATTNDVVGRIPGGTVVDAANRTDGWCAVTWKDKSGFVIQTALDMSGRPHPSYGSPGGNGPPPGYVQGPPPGYGPRRRRSIAGRPTVIMDPIGAGADTGGDERNQRPDRTVARAALNRSLFPAVARALCMFAVEMRHLRGVVALPRNLIRRHRSLDLREIFGAKT